MKPSWFVYAVFLASLWLAAGPAGAQDNRSVDRLLDEKQATFGDAAYIVLAAAQVIPEDATPDAAATAVSERGLLPGSHDPGAPITLGELACLIMKTQGMGGGILYTLFPGPRYAARELAYLRLVRGNTHPSRTVTGEEVMRILAAVLERTGGKK